jgi:hypothetical protein
MGRSARRSGLDCSCMTRTYCDCKDAVNSNATRQKLRAPRNLTIVVIDNGLKSLSRPTATATALVIMTVAHSGSLTNSNWAPTSQFRYACGSGFAALCAIGAGWAISSCAASAPMCLAFAWETKMPLTDRERADLEAMSSGQISDAMEALNSHVSEA